MTEATQTQFLVRMDGHLHQRLMDCSETEERPAAYIVREALHSYLDRADAKIRNPGDAPFDSVDDIAQGWDVMDGTGSGGRTYRVELTVSLPAMGDCDQWAYDLRDALIRTCYQSEARDVVSQLCALGPMEIDRRDRCGPACGGGHAPHEEVVEEPT